MQSNESDDDVEFRTAWESSFSAEKQSHMARLRHDKLQNRIDHVKERISMHQKEQEQSLRMAALHSEALATINTRLGEVASDLQVCGSRGRTSSS
jgi:hypothetical protein